MLKHLFKEILIFLHLDLSKNIQYDRLTKQLLKTKLQADYNCVDIGCHKGEVLEWILKYAPNGNHFGFEPLPHLVTVLQKKYSGKAQIFSFALSDYEGGSSFQYVRNAPAYSGIKKRRYDIAQPKIEEIKVELRTLDGIFSPEQRIDFIKIDVEGGEFDVLKGGKNLLKNNKPIVLFECGKGASDYYEQSLKIYSFSLRRKSV